MTQQLKSKAWADIVESLIGLIYLEAGEKAAMEFLVYLGIISEVPRGFEREQPTVHITEVNMASQDDQLAAEIAAVETAAATIDMNRADAAAPEAMQAGDMTADPVVDVAAEAAGDVAGEPAADPAAEPAGDADVTMTDAIESAGATQDTDLADNAPKAAAAPAPTTAAAAAASAGMREEEAIDAQHTNTVSGDHSKAADKITAPSADSTARHSDVESDMVVDNSGYGHTSIYHNGGPLASLHPAQPNGVHHNDFWPKGVHANGVEYCLPELSVSRANGRGASAAARSFAETHSGGAAPADNASGSAKLAADNLQPANGHVGAVIKQEGDVIGFIDPNVIDIGDGEDELQADGPILPQLQQEPKQEMAQSGYPCQSGYGDPELSKSDSEQSELPNPEEISIAEPEEESYISASSSHPALPMDTDSPAAPELANGDAPAPGLSEAAPVHPSADTIKIKIEPGLEAGGAAKPDQNQIEMDAVAFLAMNGDDSEDELTQARPRRGQVSYQSCVCPHLAASSYTPVCDMACNTSMF